MRVSWSHKLQLAFFYSLPFLLLLFHTMMLLIWPHDWCSFVSSASFSSYFPFISGFVLVWVIVKRWKITVNFFFSSVWYSSSSVDALFFKIHTYFITVNQMEFIKLKLLKIMRANDRVINIKWLKSYGRIIQQCFLFKVEISW